MKFNVEITETLWRVVTVEVKGSFDGVAGEFRAIEEAENKVREMYGNAEIILDWNDKAEETRIIAVDDAVPDDFRWM